MDDNKSPRPHGPEDIDPEEREKRRFSLVILLVIILGLSAITFILFYRKAKDLAMQTPILQQQVLTTKPNNTRLPKRELKRKPAQRREDQVTLMDIARARKGDRGQKKSREEQSQKKNEVELSLVFKKSNFSSRNFPYQELSNIVAVSSEYRDQFPTEEIVGSQGKNIFVYRDQAEGLPSAPVAYNSRSRGLGLITGILSVRFQKELFISRNELFLADESETRSFPAIGLSLVKVDGEASLEKLYSRRERLLGSPGVKAVEIEILEHDQTVK